MKKYQLTFADRQARELVFTWDPETGCLNVSVRSALDGQFQFDLDPVDFDDLEKWLKSLPRRQLPPQGPHRETDEEIRRRWIAEAAAESQKKRR